MSDSQNQEVNFTEAGRAEDLYGDLRRGLKLLELSLLGIQDVTRGPSVNADDLVPIVGFVMDLQEKLEQFSDAINKRYQEQPA